MSSTTPPAQRLSSYSTFYKPFNEGSTDTCKDTNSSTQQLSDKLSSSFQDCTKITGDAEKITKAYCSACQWNKDLYHKKEPCYLFYYWLGHTYWEDLNGHELSELLNEIYSTLGTAANGKKCDVQYENIDEDLFKHMKRVFEYYYEHGTINRGLLNSWPKCNEEWSNYVDGVSLACEAVRTNCPEGTKEEKSHCKDFNNNYRVYCNIVQALDFYCTKKTNLESDLEAARTTLTECSSAKGELQTTLSNTTPTTTTALSSIFVTLAATAFPFLLYKYKPWSSWFGNHSNGSSNRRMRISSRNEFDTLTESSTTDSIMNSTTADDSTTLRSVPYTISSTQGQPTRERERRVNNNAGGRGNVGYQNM